MFCFNLKYEQYPSLNPIHSGCELRDTSVIMIDIFKAHITLYIYNETFQSRRVWGPGKCQN